MPRYWIVFDEEILGSSDSESPILPDGYELIEGPDLPREHLYFSAGEILEKPPQPAPNAVWDEDHWVMPTPPPPMPKNDWEAFYQGISGTEVEVAIATQSNPLSFMKLGIELGTSRKTGSFDVPYLVELWNACVQTIQFSVEQIEYLNELAETSEIQVQFAANGNAEFVP